MGKRVRREGKVQDDGAPTRTGAANVKEIAAPVDLSKKIEELLKLSDEDLAKIDPDTLTELRKELNPYGRTIQGSDKYLNFSITHIAEEYQKKICITSLIAYMYRQCIEWNVPEGIHPHSVYEYLDDPSILDTPELVLKSGDKSAIYDYEFNRKCMAERIIVMKFLEQLFQFNPDEHVRSAYKPQPLDKTRPIIDTMAARLAIKHLEKTDPQFVADMELANQAKPKTKTVKKIIRNTKTGAVREEIVKVPIKESDPEPLNKASKMVGYRDPDAGNVARNFIPSHDLFGNFRRYCEENYEQLREATSALYCEKSDFEFAINPYSWHDTPEDAEEFKKKHANEVIATVYTAKSGAWNLCGPWKEQREGLKLYGDKGGVTILTEMLKQLEADQALGRDMMRKRVEKAKRKNTILTGPDAENFSKWKSQNTDLVKMGAEYVGQATGDDVPDNAIEVPVWRIAKGGTELTKTKFYTLADQDKS